MARIEKTVFISYRRTDVYTALAVYENLKNQGYDVFFDYRSISSGDFEQIITSNIRARAHFLIILTPTALDRCNEPGDWLRREIEFAIDEKRNIVPLFFKGFRFGSLSVSDKLTGKLKNLSRYNGLNVHEDYFDEAMQRVRTQFLNLPLDTVLHPVSTEVQRVVKAEQVAADEALKQREVAKEPVKPTEEKPLQKGELPKPIAKQYVKSENANRALMKATPWRLIASLAGGLALIALCIWGAVSIWNSLSSAVPEPMQTSQPPRTNTPSPTETSISPTLILDIGSTMTGKDGMTLLYVPAGEFTMGSEEYDNEKPIHTVSVDAFWIDQTEVINATYAKCVEAGVCNPPSSTKSYTRDSYYGDSKFDNYPVIYVDWNMAKTYCEWVDRRLPTEAEWEKAARGTNANIYPWGNDTPNNNLLNYNNEVGDTTEVGKYPNGASPYGALDMAGNLWEWVADWYSDTYYQSSLSSNPFGPDSGKYRVLRGGSWSLKYDGDVRSASRYGFDPSLPFSYIGFRCASSP
jgi:formylglycine-generating enzyme required for sulfatase activity